MSNYGFRPDATKDPELAHLWKTLRGDRVLTRRDLLRWSAVAAGALATAKNGIGPRRAAAAAARQDAAIATGVEITVPFDAYGNTFMLDPHRSPDYGGFWVMYPNVWAGLLGFDENGGVVLDLAETAVVSDDGLTYTFTLLPDLLYASGNPILAEHFITSWKRALDPANLSPMAGFMSLVEGFDAWVNGDEGAGLGFEAPDDRTVVIRLSQPANYFPSYAATYVWAVVDPAMVEQFGQTNFVLNYAGAGPWSFTAYTLDEVFEMTPNPNYYGGVNHSISKIIWPIVTGPGAAQEALDLYFADQAVSADVPLSLLEQVQS
ncbi:MAG: ABC transporter substrate-binding protein, partial [Chloroflexota bacterium]